MPKLTRYIIAFLLLLVLVAIRGFEDQLFYDPYLVFFESEYLYIDSPRREVAKLTFFTSLRYLLNTLASLGILYFIFNDKIVCKGDITTICIDFPTTYEFKITVTANVIFYNIVANSQIKSVGYINARTPTVENFTVINQGG